MSTQNKRMNRARMLVIIGAILILVSTTVSLSTSAIITQTSPLMFDFDTSTAPWTLSMAGANSAATFTWINSNPADPHVKLTCTSYDPTGWVGAVYFFENGALTVGQSYTVTFWYLSSTSFNMQYISQDSSYHDVDHIWVNCPASSTWTQKTLNVPSIQSAEHYILSANLYSIGSVEFDLVQVSTTAVATPAPTVTATPAPNEAKVTLSSIGGGAKVTYGGLTEACSSLAATTFYVPIGTQATISADMPETGKEFDHFEINSETTSENPIVLYQFNQDTVIRAVYKTTSVLPVTNDDFAYSNIMLWIGVIFVGIGFVDFLLLTKKVRP